MFLCHERIAVLPRPLCNNPIKNDNKTSHMNINSNNMLITRIVKRAWHRPWFERAVPALSGCTRLALKELLAAPRVAPPARRRRQSGG
eukprot:13591739-Alexandrium_andersonii.AAC.1